MCFIILKLNFEIISIFDIKFPIVYWKERNCNSIWFIACIKLMLNEMNQNQKSKVKFMREKKIWNLKNSKRKIESHKQKLGAQIQLNINIKSQCNDVNIQNIWVSNISYVQWILGTFLCATKNRAKKVTIKCTGIKL